MGKQPLKESKTVELKYAPDMVFREIGILFIVSFTRPSFLEQKDEGASAMVIPLTSASHCQRHFGKFTSLSPCCFWDAAWIKTGHLNYSRELKNRMNIKFQTIMRFYRNPLIFKESSKKQETSLN